MPLSSYELGEQVDLIIVVLPASQYENPYWKTLSASVSQVSKTQLERNWPKLMLLQRQRGSGPPLAGGQPKEVPLPTAQ